MLVTMVEGLAGLDELERPPRVVVVLDVFRASNTIISLLSAGAAEVRLLADLDQARRLKAANPEWRLWGERGGLKPPDFDQDNSPSAAGPQVAGRAVVLTTSAGTRAVHRLSRAGLVLFGSFANAGELARRLGALGPEETHLLPMGLEAREPAFEDHAAARYIAALLRGRPLDFGDLEPGLVNCAGAERLRSLGQHQDLDLCTRLDTHPLVPRVHYEDTPVARPWG